MKIQAMRKDKIVVGEKEYMVYISMEQRNDSRASIGKTGVHLRLPAGMQREELFREIMRMKRWAIEKIKEKPPEFKQKGSRAYHDGETLRVGNEEYVIRISFSEKQSSSARVMGNTFYFTLSSSLSEPVKQKHISVLLSRLVAKEKKQYMESKIRGLNQKHFNFNPRKVFLKYNSSSWGSCSEHGNINLSTRLFFAPEEVVDYVCIHELAHLQEKNHSPAFWKLVESVMPDYKDKQKWLKENSDNCWF